MHIYLSYCIKMTKRYDKYSGVNSQLLPGNVMLGFLCCILRGILSFVIRNDILLNANLFYILIKYCKDKM